MKTTLLFKRADVLFQFLALAIPLVIGMLTGKDVYAATAYLSVGGVQIISCVANKLVLDSFHKATSRKAYEITLLVVAVFCFFCWPVHGLLGVGLVYYCFAMLFIGPVMAVWYAVLTISELGVIRMLVDRKQYV